MIERLLKSELLLLLKEYPIVTLTGPRQAGKTTLARTTLPDYQYVSMEDLDNREFATQDPRGFLRQYDCKVILDEVQHAPDLLSYLQTHVDNNPETGQFILTGSHQLELNAAISQSLAGRTGLLTLLPLSIQELEAANIEFSQFEDYVFHGFLPRVYDKSLRPGRAYADYLATYVERDVRQLIEIRNAALFQKFLKLLAGRTGQLMNVNSLAGDVGIDAKTAAHWLSILETSYIVIRLQPYYENFGKRVVKSAKYYFVEPALLANLLGIQDPEQISRDPLMGQIFENLIVIEALKAQLNRAKRPSLYFFRDSHGKEIDLLAEHGRDLLGAEIKAAATYSNSFKKQLDAFSNKLKALHKQAVIYSGEQRAYSEGLELVNFKNVAEWLEGEAQ